MITTKDVGRGSGLGLSMVYGFSKQSGGHTSIYSEEDRGTTVRLYLPRATEASQEQAAYSEVDVPCGRGETILVVEDDPDVLDLAATLLEELSYRVVVAENAAAARALMAQENEIDLILSDVVLPGGVSGPEFAVGVRETHPDIEFIFMSGYPAAAVKTRDLLEFGAPLLTKPFGTQRFAQAIRVALDRSQP